MDSESLLHDANAEWNRPNLPAVLKKAEVPLEVWHATYDAVDVFRAEFPLKTTKRHYIGYAMILASTLICVIMSIFYDDGQSAGNDVVLVFIVMVLAFGGIFQSLHTLLPLNRERSIAWHRLCMAEKFRYASFGITIHPTAIGGLRFDVAPIVVGQHQRSIVEALQKLHLSNGLTDEEFMAAKRILLLRASAKRAIGSTPVTSSSSSSYYVHAPTPDEPEIMIL